jgi:hypothetical protein
MDESVSRSALVSSNDTWESYFATQYGKNSRKQREASQGVRSSDISNVCYLLPGHGKTPSWVYEPTGVHSKGASYGEYNSQLSQCMDCAEKHDSNQTIGDDERGRASAGQSGSRPDEEAGA